jgi:hypothetical protein
MYIYIDTYTHARTQGCANPGREVTGTAKFCTVAPNILGFSIWIYLHVTLLALWILTWLHSWKICVYLNVFLRNLLSLSLSLSLYIYIYIYIYTRTRAYWCPTHSSVSAVIWVSCIMRVAQKVMFHIFYRKLFIHSITGCFLYTLFFHIIFYVYGLTPARKKKGMHAFPVPARFLFT